MKNKASFTFSLLLIAILLLACSTTTQDSETVVGTGSTVEQTREVGDFSGVELAMNGTLHISMGDTSSLRVEAQNNLLQYIQTETRGDTLLIHTTPGINVEGTRPIQYYLTVKKLNNLQISSSGDIEAGNLKSDALSIKIASSGDVTIDSLDCPSLDVQIASSGDLKIAGGQIQAQTIQISSSGEYLARDVSSTRAEVHLTSSGPATVRVSDRLSGQLSSSGNLYCAGDPKVDVKTTSSGKVIQID